MPPKVKITKKMVADASFEVIRANGHENLNARTISEYLGCSTQPVLYSFKTVGEIREAAYEIADGYHTSSLCQRIQMKIRCWLWGLIMYASVRKRRTCSVFCSRRISLEERMWRFLWLIPDSQKLWRSWRQDLR